MIKLASDIHEFLDALAPFDPDSVELKKGQVELAYCPRLFKNIEIINQPVPASFLIFCLLNHRL